MRGEDRINADRATNTNRPRELLLCGPYDMCGVGRIEMCFQRRVKKASHSEKFWPTRKDKVGALFQELARRNFLKLFFVLLHYALEGPQQIRLSAFRCWGNMKYTLASVLPERPSPTPYIESDAKPNPCHISIQEQFILRRYRKLDGAT